MCIRDRDTFDLQAKTTISAEDREYWLMVLKSLTAGVAERARDSELENHDEEEHEKSSARASLDEHHAFVNYDAYDFESNNNYRKKTPSERAEQFRNAYDSLLDRLLKDPFGWMRQNLSFLFVRSERRVFTRLRFCRRLRGRKTTGKRCRFSRFTRTPRRARANGR